MLPSMPVLFTRDSQDAFGNKIEPSTSFFGQHNITKQLVQPTFQPPAPRPPSPRPVVKECKPKEDDKDKDLNEEETKKLDENEQEAALAAAYFNKIRSKFASHTRVPHNNKFVQFRDILKAFDPAKETPVELYKKIETMFGEEHKYLADEFLLFLTPGQTTEIGMFMDQFVMLQMKAFIDLLQSTFARKPTMLRKVLRAITNSLNCGSTDEMRAKVLPHLRANPRLQHMYRALFPDARPPDSVYECGVDKIAEGFLSDDPGYDAWQLEDKAEDKRRNLEAKEQLDSVYLQGRVYLQHGRHLRPARLAFPYSALPHRTHARRLAPAHDPDPEPEPDPPAAPAKRRRGKKDVNDNTKAEPKARKRRPKKDPEKKDPKDPNPRCRKKKKEVKNNSWTREEDKTILEVLKGGSVPDEVLVKIKKLLPHRTASEIKERFFHVMTLLQQMMAVGEVT